MQPIALTRLFLPFLIVAGLLGKTEIIKFDHFSDQAHAPNSYINAIHQDQPGFMWFGTDAGLVKYNGYDFIHYSSDPFDEGSLSSNIILSICSDETGKGLWVGQQNGILDKFDATKETFSQYKIPHIVGASPSFMNVKAILPEMQGDLWVGTQENGLYKFLINQEKFEGYASGSTTQIPLEESGINALFEDNMGILWIATSTGLYRFDPHKKSFTQYLIDEDDFESDRNYLTSIILDASNRLLVGTEAGELLNFDPALEKFNILPGFDQLPGNVEIEGVISLFLDSKDIVWIGTWDGLIHYDSNDAQLFLLREDPYDPYSLSDGSITSIYEDRSGLLWFGTADGGINTHYRRKAVFQHTYHNPSFSGSLSSNLIYSICSQRSGVLWIGTSSGLNRLRPDGDKFQHITTETKLPFTLPQQTISTMFEDSGNQLWIGTEGGGIIRWNDKENIITQFLPEADNPETINDGFISAFAEDKAGNLWIGTQDFGVNLWKANENVFSYYQHDSDDLMSLSSDRISSILCDHEGQVWIGTLDAGLNRYDPQKDEFIHYFQNSDFGYQLNGGTVHSIFEDSQNRLWIGTDIGLNKFNRESGIFQLTTSGAGHPAGAIYSIIEDKRGDLWLATHDGLSRFEVSENSFKNFSISDGLQSNRFYPEACDISEGGELFFGGNNGFNRFFPDSIQTHPFLAPIEITSFKIFDKEVKIKGSLAEISKINLKHEENFFSFDFTSLDFTYPQHNQYAYKMKGFDEGWVYSGSRNYASYTNLNPGSYIFSVKATNSDGVWTDQEREIELYIAPPFWRTWWFILGISLLIASVVYALVRYRLSLMQIRTQNLQEEVDKQTGVLMKMNKKLGQANVMKEMLLDVITHDLRNPIGVIEGMSEFMLKKNPDEAAISLIRSSSQSMVRVMENATTLAAVALDEKINMVTLNVCDIINQAIQDFSVELDSMQIIVENLLDEESLIVANPIIEEVFKNYISNAMKYASDGKRIIIGHTVEEGLHSFYVKDFGETIPAEKREAIFHRGVQLEEGKRRGSGLGLAIVKRIAAAHSAEVGVLENHPQGNIFYFKIKE